MAISSPRSPYSVLAIAPHSPSPASPRALPPLYKFEGSVPSGPLSVVHLARHLPSNKPVVLKTYLKRDLHRHGAIALALAERETLAAVHGIPGAAQLLHATHDARSLTLILLRAPGVPASSLGAVPLARAARIVRSIVLAMRGIHSRSVVHRDLALRNILVAADDSVTVVDFGAAVPRGRIGPLAAPAVTPPEALAERPQAPPADVWGLGVATFSLLTGLPAPFRTIEEVERFAKKPTVVLKNGLIGGSASADEKQTAADFVHACLNPLPEMRLGSRMTAEGKREKRECSQEEREARLWDLDYDAILAHPFLTKTDSIHKPKAETDRAGR